MPRIYTLDQLAMRIHEREVQRATNAEDLTLEGIGAVGGWNSVSAEYRKNWNLTDDDMYDIESALQNNSVFETEIVKTKETTVAQCNDAVQRMKRGDCSKFNHLPPFLREYYGKISLREFFGDARGIPPLDQEMKNRLKVKCRCPEFRYMITQLIERNGVDSNGQPMAEQLREYDRYMNRYMLSQTLAPITTREKTNLQRKYNRETANRLINENKEKQRFMAKTLFMAQLGRVDIYTDDEQASPFNDTVTELFSHGSRVIFTLPRGDSNSQTALFDEWKRRALNINVLSESRMASHDITRRHVTEAGEKTQDTREIKLKWSEQLKNREFGKKAFTYFDNYGMNIPLGGLGKAFNRTDCVDGQGAFGHFYIRAKEGERTRCGVIMIGLENAAPGSDSCIGQHHGTKAIGHDMSPFFSNRKNIGKAYGGREVDLSHIQADDLTKALNLFDRGYSELQREADHDEEAARKLNIVNQKLTGKYMSAIELAALMTSLGMEKKDAVRLARQGRNPKDAPYPDTEYAREKYMILDPAAVADRPTDPVGRAHLTDLRNMSSYVDSMRRQWNSMANHTLFKSWNTKEFQNMENALNKFLTAYDNVMAGKTADGKEFRADTSRLSDMEYAKIRDLEMAMAVAGQEYHQAKVAKKEGGFEKHSTDQARDRDAMSLMLRDFPTKARTDTSETLTGATEQQKNTNARRKLTAKVTKLDNAARHR